MRGARAPLSLYVHIPFCNVVCYYCACNKVVTKDRSKAVTYLGYLKQEIDMQGKLFAGMNRVEQLHFGGGTPTYLDDDQMGELLAHMRKQFEFAPDAEGEYSIEIDPRTVDAGAYPHPAQARLQPRQHGRAGLRSGRAERRSTASSRRTKRWR